MQNACENNMVLHLQYFYSIFGKINSMKKVVAFFILLINLMGSAHAQTVIVGNISPTPKDTSAALEVQKALKAKVNIQSANFNDTAWLQLSNRNEFSQGTDFNIVAIRENGMYFNTRSDLPSYTNDSLLTLLRTGNVGIGTRNPGSKLDVVGNIRMRDGQQAAGKVMQSDATGVASWQPKTFGFSATGTMPAISNIQNISNNTLTTVTNINQEAYDEKAMYNPATGTLTIPEAGVYHIDVQLQYYQASAGNYSIYLYVDANFRYYNTITLTGSASFDKYLPLHLSADIKLNAGDVITIRTQQVSGATQILLGGFSTHFNMHKLY